MQLAAIAALQAMAQNMRLPRKGAASLRVLENGAVFLPLRYLAVSFVSRQSIGVLNAADELVAFSRDNVEIVIGELAPLLLHLALECLPITFHTIPIH